MLRVSEKFVGVQGEGYRTGIPTLFVRLAGCNFIIDGHPCKWPCDTLYAGTLDKGKQISMADLCEWINKTCLTRNIGDVCLTGGEPLIQSESKDLIEYLAYRYNLLVMTNGSVPIWDSKAIWNMDCKCPGSGNHEYTNWENMKYLKPKDQIKFVIASKEDFDYMKTVVNSRVVFCNVVIQPAWKMVDLRDLITWLLEEPTLCKKVRIGTQLHKHAFPKKTRGV